MNEENGKQNLANNNLGFAEVTAQRFLSSFNAQRHPPVLKSPTHLGDALAVPCVALVPQLEGLVDARGGARGDGGPEDALLGRQIDLDGGVAAAVVDLPGVDLLDGHGAADRSNPAARDGVSDTTRDEESRLEGQSGRLHVQT